MLVNIHGKNVEITDAMQERVEEKLQFLNKYFDLDDSWRTLVVVHVVPEGKKVEITITSKIGTLRAEVLNLDFYSAIDKAIDKLEDQIRRHKTRISRRNREGLSTAFLKLIEDNDAEEANESKLVRTKTVDAETMNLEEAILRMEMLNHSFFIYTDDETQDIAVVYKRLDGDYGLLEVE